MISRLPLPAPGPEEESWSRNLTDVIRDEIDSAGGVIPFSRFMELALYEPRYGYYMSGLRKLGEDGDFVTAPELGDLFSRCLLKLINHVLDRQDGGEVLELGAGTGIMAAQLLGEMERTGTLPERYLILDIGDDLRRRQRTTIETLVPGCIDRVEWLTELPRGFRGVVLANEVADALPVDRFCLSDGQVQGIGVSRNDSGFEDRPFPLQGAEVERLSERGLPDGYFSEIGLFARAWMRTLCQSMESGVILVVDYGYPDSELYHPMRSEGTLMCHYRHHAHGNPYTHIGLQDITAHVDFSALARCAHETGHSVLGFTTQASFLLSLDILELIGPDPTTIHADSISLAQEVKRLTLPSAMGETFKALAVGSSIEGPLPGFTVADHRARL
jgi:SAM-dependent MidA family methyltransferase